MTQATNHVHETSDSLESNGKLVVALPEPSLSMSQDAEWCVVQMGDEWRQIRFHDYDALFSVPGLYEKVIYEVLKCNSPRVIRELFEAELKKTNTPAERLRVLDLGAGNGMVGEELAGAGVPYIVGVDIIPEAKDAALRDRPGLYDAYEVVDMTDLEPDEQQRLAKKRLNALTCVAALGFGDIPPRAFAEAYNVVTPGGWVAFNIKEDFLTAHDQSGFAVLIRTLLDEGLLEIRQRRLYQHRLATNGDPLKYEAIIGIKRGDVPESLIP